MADEFMGLGSCEVAKFLGKDLEKWKPTLSSNFIVANTMRLIRIQRSSFKA